MIVPFIILVFVESMIIVESNTPTVEQQQDMQAMVAF